MTRGTILRHLLMPSILLSGSACAAPDETCRGMDRSYLWRATLDNNNEETAPSRRVYEAIANCDHRLLEQLLSDRRLANLRLNALGYSPLMFAVRMGDERAVVLLVDSGADLNAILEGGGGATALTVAVDQSIEASIESGSPEADTRLIALLLELGADPNVALGNGWDVALIAGAASQLQALRLFLAHGYNRDLPRLKRFLEITQLVEAAEVEEHAIMLEVDRLMDKRPS